MFILLLFAEGGVMCWRIGSELCDEVFEVFEIWVLEGFVGEDAIVLHSAVIYYICQKGGRVKVGT